MFDLIDRLEGLGPTGAPWVLGAALALGLGALAAVGWSFTFDPDTSRWVLLGVRGTAAVALAAAGLLGMVGVRLRTAPRYPDPAEVFPSLSVEAFKAALYEEDRPLAACSDCRIHLPGRFDTGSCPRCGSAVSWLRIDTDEDAELVCSAVVD